MAQNIIVVSHRRSGTHLVIDSIINNFKPYAKNPRIDTLTLDCLSLHSSVKTTRLDELIGTLTHKACVIKTHAHGHLSEFFIGDDRLQKFIQELFGSSKIIYVHRDGRDVLVSLYYYIQLFDESVKEINFSQFIRSADSLDSKTYRGMLSRPAYWKYHVQSWINRKDICFISFRDLTLNYYATMDKIAGYIDQPEPAKIDVRRRGADKTPNQARVISKLMTRVRRGPLYSSVGFRKGGNGDWTTHFSKEDLEFFNEQAGDVNSALGYS